MENKNLKKYMQNDKITIGIPIYNAAEWLERSLLSALNQTYSNIEYIFVDDKGNSMDIVRQVLETHPRGNDVRIIAHEKNRGISASRNTALNNATGRYFFTMDCDDTIAPDCIAKLYAAMCEHPVDFVAGSFVLEDMQGKKFGGCHYSQTLVEGEEGSHSVAYYRYGSNHRILAYAWNRLYDIDFLRKHHIQWEEEYTLIDDAWFTYQVLLCAKSCLLIPDVTLFYLCNSSSVTGRASAQGYSEPIARQFVSIEKKKSAYIAPLADAKVYRGLLADIMKMGVYHSYRVIASLSISPKLQRKYAYNLLHLDTIPPRSGAGNYTLWYCTLRLFFALPMSLKLGLVRLMVAIDLKQKIKRWIHF